MFGQFICGLGNSYFLSSEYEKAILQYGDVLKISPDDAANLQTEFGLSIDPELDHEIPKGELGEIEAMITPRSRLIGRKFNYFMRVSGGDVLLLGLWRQGSKFRRRLAREIFKSGDVLLISSRSSDERVAEKLELLGLIPLWHRELDVIRDTSKVYQALAVFILSLDLIIKSCFILKNLTIPYQ